MDGNDIQAILADLKQRLQAEFGAEMSRLLVYGSVARGENRADSDIDVMVVFRESGDMHALWDRVLDVASDVSYDYDTFITALVTTEEELATRANPLFMNIRREAVAV